MEPVKKSEFNDPIIFTKILDDDRLIVVDSKSTVRFLDKESLKIKSGFKLNFSYSRFETRLVDFTSDAKNFVILSQDCRESRLYSTQRKKIVSIMDRHHGRVSCVGIDPKNRHVISGGEDGKVFAVDIKSGQHSFNLSHHIDTVNDIVFSENGQLIATAGYDKKISIFSLSMMKQKHQLKSHMAPIVKLLFLDENRLFSVDKRSVGTIWDIHNGMVIKKLDSIHDDITQVCASSDGEFLFLGSKLGYIIVFDLHTYELIERRYLKFKSEVTSLNFDKRNHQLIIGTKNGELLFYDIYSDEFRINELLRQKKYLEVEKYVLQNPLLRYTKSYKTMDALWHKTIEKAKYCLGKNDKKSALKLLESFESISSKKQTINKLLKDYEDFHKLVEFLNNGKIALAYGLANKHPIYKESTIYESMQKKWKLAFYAAQKCILEPKGYDKAKEILSPYRGISEKTVFIQGLLTNADVHNRFKLALGQKSFKVCYELIKQHPFLKEYTEYETLKKYAKRLYEKSNILIKKGDTYAAIKIIKTLLDFEDYKKEAKEMLAEVEAREFFFNAIENNNMSRAYQYLDTYDSLQVTKEGKRLQELWDNDINTADEYASKGDIDGVKDTLEKYTNIDSKKIVISTIISWCYTTQLQNALKSKEAQEKIEKGIKNYVLYCGLTEQIFGFYESFKALYPKTKISLESLPAGSITNRRLSAIVKFILD